MTPLLVVMTGFKQVGKDYLLQRFTEHMKGKLEVRRLSFSDELKHIANHIFPWLPKDISPELKDIPFDHPKNKQGLTPREIWVLVANDKTGICFVQDDVLVDLFAKTQLPKSYEENVLYVISDMRKIPEYELANLHKCKKVRIWMDSRKDVSKEDPVEAAIPTFEVDVEFTNHHDEASVEAFNLMMEGLIEDLKQAD